MELTIQTTASGTQHKLDLNRDFLAQARDAGAPHPLAHMDRIVRVDAGMPTPRQQAYHQLGLNRRNITVADAMNCRALLGAGPVTEADQVTGRLAVQAYLFDAIEGTLRDSDYGIQGLFNRKAAQIDSIANTKFDRPIIDYTEPEKPRSKAIAQLSEPARMLVLTVSDNSYKIPGTSIGIEYSDQAASAVTLPIIQLSIQRQAEVENLERVERYLLGFLNGDSDFGMSPLSAVPGAVKAASSYDPAATGGKLTQTAWVLWLFDGSRKRRIDTIICDMKTALAIEAREGRWTVQTDNATSKRIDTLESIVNPTWPDKVEIIVSQDPAWPAGTIVGFDSRYGYHVVNSTTLAYEAMEQFAIRRSTKMRFDHGSVAYRLYDDAWSVLTLT